MSVSSVRSPRAQRSIESTATPRLQARL